MDDDDILEIDSPEQEMLDDVIDEVEVDALLDGAETPSITRKVSRRVEKPRHEQLEYSNALPYETESLDEMDIK
jgi:hypothetical protein